MKLKKLNKMRNKNKKMAFVAKQDIDDFNMASNKTYKQLNKIVKKRKSFKNFCNKKLYKRSSYSIIDGRKDYTSYE